MMHKGNGVQGRAQEHDPPTEFDQPRVGRACTVSVVVWVPGGENFGERAYSHHARFRVPV